MKIIEFLKSPEKAISDWDGVEWHWTKRDAVVGAIATVACITALSVHGGESNHTDTVDVVPVHEVVEVDN